MNMKVGYVRTSTVEQNEARQVKALLEHGAEKIFTDKQSGKDTKRPQLQALLAFVREGDTVIVESYSRFSRSTADLLGLVHQLKGKGVDFVSLKENIDTATPQGKFIMTIFSGLAQFERECILQRQRQGIEIAKAEGKYKGRQPIKVDKEVFTRECQKWLTGEQSAVETMSKLGLKPNTFYRRCKELGIVPARHR